MSSSLFTKIIDENEFVSLPTTTLNKILGKNSISNFVRPFKFHNKDKHLSILIIAYASFSNKYF